MLIRLLCAHEMTKHVFKILRLNSKRLLRKLQKKMLGGYFILPHPVGLYAEDLELLGEMFVNSTISSLRRRTPFVNQHCLSSPFPNAKSFAQFDLAYILFSVLLVKFS